MPSEKNKKESGGNWRPDEEKDKLQAIIIADSFNRKFTPITQDMPRALLPLGNRVMLDYTMQYLLNVGVDEVIIFCCAFGEKIRNYVKENWKSQKNFTINCVLSSESDCISLGDALREIDREGLIRSDFLLVPGDLISNIDISEILEKHKAQRKKEKNLVMTLLYRELAPGHFSRCKEDDSFIAMDSETNQIVQYQKAYACRSFALSNNVLASGRDMDVHYDLSFTQLALCSPQVAPLFTDNFDYQTIDDFIRGILINEDIMGDKLNGAILQNGYSCRINDLHMYNAVSLDILGRWAHPITLDSSKCPLRRNNVYIHNDVIVEKNCRLKSKVLVGENTTIGEGSSITQSVVGSNCKIGRNVIIKNSFIWDNTVIEDDCSVIQSIVCENCLLRRNVKMVDCIISYNVCLDEDLTLKPCSRISMRKPHLSGDDDDIEEEMKNLKLNTDQEFDEEVVGKNGKGYLWPLDVEEEGFLPSLTGNDYETSEGESSDEEDEDSSPPSPPQELSNLHQFHIEVVENLKSGFLENIAPDNIALEINASKFKFNISITELCQTVIKALLELSIKDETSKADQVKEFDKISKALHPLLVKYYNTSETQMYALHAMEEYFLCTVDSTMYSLLASCLHKMYDADVLDEEVVLKWFSNPSQLSDMEMTVTEEQRKELRESPNLLKFVTWLQEAEEEDSEEDESD